MQTLLIDADDTLWENNIYFLEVTALFLEAVAGFGVDAEMAERTLSETERRNLPAHGYGSAAFARSVEEAFIDLVPEAPLEIVNTLVQAAQAIAWRDGMELLGGVEDTLQVLSADSRLILVTKGNRDEQRWKLRSSGLARYFTHVEVVSEKDVETYRRLMRRYSLDPLSTWMIGNSPRSDINPALEAGLSAILVPHDKTWELELEDVGPETDRFRVVRCFADVPSVLPRADTSCSA